MNQSPQQLADQLLKSIIDTQTLKEVSAGLEELSQNKHLKTHLNAVVSDSSLTSDQQKTQLSYIIRGIESTVVYSFFQSLIDEGELWVFQSGKIDYLDRFVQTFQQATHQAELVSLITAVPLEEDDLSKISHDLSQAFGKHIILSTAVKASLIGGAQIKIENMVYDFSLSFKFQQFERQWLRTLTSQNRSLDDTF